jgi:alkylated DNA repair protein alkB homolog 6
MEAQSPQLTALPASLEEVRIEQLPSNAYYIADFISKEEEQVLLDKVSFTPLPPVLY